MAIVIKQKDSEPGARLVPDAGGTLIQSLVTSNGTNVETSDMIDVITS